MCGRYALALRPSEVRQQLQKARMPVDEAPDDDDNVRQSYNFAPGYFGLVYRADNSQAADGPDVKKESGVDVVEEEAANQGGEGAKETNEEGTRDIKKEGATVDTKYKLQAMQWGLVPFWTKRNPDYSSKLKTINCRDDSLLEDRGMWTTMKKKKRCIIIAQGFFEWLKKNNGKDRLPHFTKRKDGQLMCFAGLWDCVQFEDSSEKLFTYSIITTDSNKQLHFLHDRMPVILENGSDAIRTWLDPTRTEWNKDLQSLLQPFQGQLECYQVNKDVGKVGNNSPSFLVPIDSAANKNNIANFFGTQKKPAKVEAHPNKSSVHARDARGTVDGVGDTKDHAQLPIQATTDSHVGEEVRGIKREHSDEDDKGSTADVHPSPKRSKPVASASPTKPSAKMSPAKKQGTRSATSNGSAAKNPSKADGSMKITSFFSNR